MDALELLDKRRHVMKWSDDIPDKALIEKVLWKAWKVTPSKNNFMAYNVNVYGPDQMEMCEKIRNLSKKNKKRTNETHIPREKTTPGVLDNELTEWDDGEGENIYFDHLATAPYLVVYSQRICEPNEYYAESVKQGDYYEPMHLSELPNIIRGVSVEVGMFAANLGAFALEAGLDTSTTLCFPAEYNDGWQDIEGVDHPVMLMQSIGYCGQSKREFADDWANKADMKPKPETVIRWI